MSTIVNDALNFKMKKSCVDCPFRKDKAFLEKSRAKEIVENLRNNGYFPCHKTIDYDYDEEGEEQATIRTGSSHCAGSIILMLREGDKSSWMQVCERLKIQDWGGFKMDDEVDETYEEFINKHK